MSFQVGDLISAKIAYVDEVKEAKLTSAGAGGEAREFQRDRDYTVMGFSAQTTVQGEAVFVGYGVEGGSSADATIYTLGWGGVRKLPMAKPQWGFYGKFLRYRRFEDETHGVHHGLSVGTESGAGALGLRFEIGAARSDQNHWLAVAQIAFTLELPFGIPRIGGDRG
jgi:hypothetical protein